MADERVRTLTGRMRAMAAGPLERVGSFLARLGIHPDWISVAGLAIVAAASVFIAAGEFLAGGLLFGIGAMLDAVDGAVARAMRRRGAFGMVLDSSLDRYADGFIFAALGYYFAGQGRMDMLLLALLALVGSYMVSYVRARAEDSKVGLRVTAGWFSRLERVAVLLIMLVAAGLFRDARLLEAGLAILAAGTNLTALQRLRYVRSGLKDRGK